MKIREQVTAGVLSALEAIGPNEEAMRRAIIRLSLPDAAVQGPTYLVVAGRLNLEGNR